MLENDFSKFAPVLACTYFMPVSYALLAAVRSICQNGEE